MRVESLFHSLYYREVQTSEFRADYRTVATAFAGIHPSTALDSHLRRINYDVKLSFTRLSVFVVVEKSYRNLAMLSIRRRTFAIRRSISFPEVAV